MVKRRLHKTKRSGKKRSTRKMRGGAKPPILPNPNPNLLARSFAIEQQIAAARSNVTPLPSPVSPKSSISSTSSISSLRSSLPTVNTRSSTGNRNKSIAVKYLTATGAPCYTSKTCGNLKCFKPTGNERQESNKGAPGTCQ